MLKRSQRLSYFFATIWLSVVTIVVMFVAARTAAAQPSPLVYPLTTVGSSATQYGNLSGELSTSMPATAGRRPTQITDDDAGDRAGSNASTDGRVVRTAGFHRITLQQVKQQQARDRVMSPLARFSQLQVEAAKQHRLGVQADYFPKFGATFANLHFTDFLGQVLTLRRPIAGTTSQVPVPLFSQNQTVAYLSFVQPITPLLEVNQAVRIARADERIAMARAGASITRKARETEIEELYFRLLIAQRRLVSAELKRKNGEKPHDGAPITLVASHQDLDSTETKKALATTTTEVQELTASLNRILGWPDDAELELVPPDPLVENITLEEVADKSAANNFDVIEAEQTLVKARAASTISKLAYVPTVAAVGGYLFQNVIPLVPSNFG